jgi:hypothetical protein
MIESFSLHKITNEKQLSFSAVDYSKFKFGSKKIARAFGVTLAQAFAWEYVLPRKLDKQLVVLSSPYCFIPTATHAMKDYFIRELNDYLIQCEYPVVQETKIHRTITYKEDYGELSAEDRLKLIQNDGFHIDVNFIKNKQLLLLDDIKITGSHERVIERMFNTQDIDPHRIYLYFAELCNSEINPKIENVLNYAYVSNLLDLDKIIKNDEFILNTRIVKYILIYDHTEFVNFINYQKNKLVETIYHAAIGNSYHLIPEYVENLNYIKKLISK